MLSYQRLQGANIRVINLAPIIAHLSDKKIEVVNIFFELPTLRKSFIHCFGHREKHFHNFLMNPSYQKWGSISRSLIKKGFYCNCTVETLLFICSLCMTSSPLSVSKKTGQVTASHCIKCAYITIKRLPCLPCDEG